MIFFFLLLLWYRSITSSILLTSCACYILFGELSRLGLYYLVYILVEDILLFCRPVEGNQRAFLVKRNLLLRSWSSKFCWLIVHFTA